MQATTATPTQAPAAPAAPPAPAAPVAPRPATITITGADGATQTLMVPLSRGEVRDLRARRSELSDQLISATGRRHDLSEEIKSAPSGASRTGLEERLGVLDKRIVQLESDIATTGQQLSAAGQGLTGSADFPIRGDIPENVAALSGAFTMFVLFPIAFAIARNIWKRGGKAPSHAVQLPPETGERLERLEQGMDAIAIEIERVAEGQRFVTRLLSEGTPHLRTPAVLDAETAGAAERR
ncbi:MAG: hypothetical protein ABI681_05505 [Gemmatimonadales bacterium]